MIHYKVINTAIVTSEDVPAWIRRDHEFYKYLLHNSVAYYYSSYISKEKSIIDKKVIATGNVLNEKFIKTLRLIAKISKEKKLDFLLFKTHKYFPEVVDNDIDLIVKKEDFYTFLNALENEDFHCIEEESLKAKCVKNGYCKIEPRVTSSSRGRTFLDEKTLWKSKRNVRIDDMPISATSKEIDVFHQLLSILYNPNYLKLYVFFLYNSLDIKELYHVSQDKYVTEDLRFLHKYLLKNWENKRFPLLLGNINFCIWWFKRICFASDIILLKKLTLIVSFFYMKYAFIIFHKLVYHHAWPLHVQDGKTTH